MTAKKIKVTRWECECAQCGFKWESRDENKPRVCGKCKSHLWEKGKEERMIDDRKIDSTRTTYKPDLDGTLDGQWSFDFKDWEQAFELFYRKKRMNKEYALVISTHWVTSGYWVERNPKSDEYSTIYRSMNAVRELEKRIRERGEEVCGLDDLKRKDCINLSGLVT